MPDDIPTILIEKSGGDVIGVTADRPVRVIMADHDSIDHYDCDDPCFDLVEHSTEPSPNAVKERMDEIGGLTGLEDHEECLTDTNIPVKHDFKNEVITAKAWEALKGTKYCDWLAIMKLLKATSIEDKEKLMSAAIGRDLPSIVTFLCRGHW